MIDLERQDGVCVLHMRNGENRFNLEVLDRLNAALDEVEKSGAPTLVTTGIDKFYSNGMDLDRLLAEGGEILLQRAIDEAADFFVRLSLLPAITVAAINGHCYAGGAILAMAHDVRIMRADRGFFCMPEIDIQVPLPVKMTAIIRPRLSPMTCRDVVLFGRRYTAAEAHAAGIIDELAADENVLPRALEIARTHGEKHPPTVGAMKRALYLPHAP